MLAPPSKHHMKGLTLIELLVSAALSVTILAAAISLTVTITKERVKTINQREAETHVVEVAKLMMSDIKRGGYWNNAVSDLYSGNNSNPFTNIYIENNNCISLSYDEDNDGTQDKSPGSISLYAELYGFRYNSSTSEIQTSHSAATNTNTCLDADSRWQGILTPPYFTATGLTINNRTATSSLSTQNYFVDSRLYDISITGTEPVIFTTKNRNDKVYSSPGGGP